MPSPIDPQGRDVARALTRLREDPNLSGEDSMRVLRWAGDTAREKPDSSWTDWILELFRWLSQSSRILVWIMAIGLAALLALYVYRMARDFRRHSASRTEAMPSHVRDLDIRPESLPADIGDAARQLWETGDHRAALALLYRALLSRLVHAHGIAIRESSTEGDCLALIGADRNPHRNEYATRLIRVWQRAVYGAQEPDDQTALALCAEFAAALDRPTQSEPAMQPA